MSTLPQFALLSADEQRAAIQRLASQGWSDHEIARLARLRVEEVRRAIAASSAQCYVLDVAPENSSGAAESCDSRNLSAATSENAQHGDGASQTQVARRE
jgi:hypothetical protein